MQTNGRLSLYFIEIDSKEEISVSVKSGEIYIHCKSREKSVGQMIGDALVMASDEKRLQSTIKLDVCNCEIANVLQSNVANKALKGQLSLQNLNVSDQSTLDQVLQWIQNDKIVSIRNLRFRKNTKLSFKHFGKALLATTALKELTWYRCEEEGMDMNLDQLKRHVKVVSQFNFSLLEFGCMYCSSRQCKSSVSIWWESVRIRNLEGPSEDDMSLRAIAIEPKEDIRKSSLSERTSHVSKVERKETEAVVHRTSEVGFAKISDMLSLYESKVKVSLSLSSSLAEKKQQQQQQQQSPWRSGMCPAQLAKQILSKNFALSQAHFDAEQDLCYCNECCAKRNDKDCYFRGKPPMKYVIPRGWVRVGLQVPKGKVLDNKVFDEWHVAFHGTDVDGVRGIFNCGLQLLKPGDVKLGGDKISISRGHIMRPFQRTNLYTNEEELFDPNQIFTSPSIKFNFICIRLYIFVYACTCLYDRYAAHGCYAKSFYCEHPQDRNRFLRVEFGFQVRQRPGSYSIGQETVGAMRDGIVLDEYFNNSELEWYTQENVGIVVYGLLMKIREADTNPSP
ncbi:SPRY domain containing protein [Reticulomyxa filosa]|uniref:SPRY domain containing protein n=1 Tax=Reticulomyxa filosa TaxID=46433 RepID=X6N4H7_RETFI|nr:SPRY domain containing protein [Reticulomyxa filosa]|eukprot:ETO20227.1 SPRY domain containing protein [Reticulomyxa filosa]